MRKYVCQCGGVIVGEPPERCPHCGAKVARLKQRVNIWPPLIIAALFAILIAFLVWLAKHVQ